MKQDFEKYARSRGISSLKLHDYNKFMNRGGGYLNPMILEERELNVTSMDVFSRLMYERQIFLGTAIFDDVANIINAQLLYLESVSDDDITILVNSPGGSVNDGLAIIDTMNYITPDITTISAGLSASMGAVILSCGTKGKRFSLPHSRIMIHQPLGGAEGQCTDILIAAEEIKYLKEVLCGILAEQSGQPYEKVVEDCERDNWMTSLQAKEYGLIDDIVKSKKIK